MRKEKGGKRGRKKMDEREKESQVEERSEVITEEGSERREEEEIQEDPAIGEAVVEEEERCEEDPECHSSAKRARVCATFTDSEEVSIVEFVKLHPELYVWHGVCLFVHLNKLCLAWGLSVCPSQQVMFGMGFVCLSV